MMYEDFVMPRFCYSLFVFSFVIFVHNTTVYSHSHRLFLLSRLPVNFNEHLELI